MSALVSVILPTYNDGQYLAAAIRSVLDQTYKNLEVIVVNDGSTDNTSEMLASITDDRVKVFHIANGGVSAARNFGLAQARGEYVTFQDGDDLYRPGKLTLEVSILEQEPDVGAVFGDFVRFNEQGVISNSFEFIPELDTLTCRASGIEGADVIREEPFSQIVRFNQFPSSLLAVTFRRSVLQGIEFQEVIFDERGRLLFDEISDFALRAYAKTNVAWHRDIVADVRRHDSNMSALVKPIELAKLNTLLALRAEPLSVAGRKSLNRRIAMQRLRAAHYWFASRRSYWRGVKEVVHALISGQVLSAGKALLLSPMVYWRGEDYGI